MRPITLLTAALMMALAPARLGADGEGSEDGPVARRLELAELAAPPAARGPMLAAPSDLVHDERGATEWSKTSEPEGTRGRAPWIELPEPEGSSEPPQAVSLDNLIEAVRWGVGLGWEGLSVNSEGGALRLVGPRKEADLFASALPWAVAGLAPSALLRATLTTGPEGGLVAQARARLFAGRWTRVWLQEERPRFACDWSIEIAQASTVVRPDLHELPEGQELYARWLPGETLSLVELWSGDLEHQEVVELDLTAVRNVPEASGLGPVRAPRTALRRGFTAVAFPGARAPTRELLWEGPEGARRLTLALEDVTPTPAPRATETDPPTELVWLRSGAVAVGTLFESRVATVETLVQEMVNVGQFGGRDFDLQVASHGTSLALRSDEPVRALLRARLAEMERELADADLALRVLTVPEESARAALKDGSLAAGRVLEGEAARLVEGAGTVRGHAVSLPLVAGVKAGLRCGASVPGLVALDVEVAQESGGTEPIMGAVFAGLAGEVRMTRTQAGLAVVDVDLTLSWADPRGGRADLTVRPPVWMTQTAGRTPVETDVPKRVTLPTLSSGAAEVAGRLEVGPADASERLLGVVVRGSDVSLVIGRAVAR